MPTLLYIVPEAGFFLSHRLPLGLAAQKAGYRVSVACPPSPETAEIAAHGFSHISIEMPRGATSPFAELASLRAQYSLLKNLRPHVTHLVTAKPMLYGGLAARVLGLNTVSAVTGLGFVFIRKGLKATVLRQIIRRGYGLALNRKSNHVIFQNPDDRALFQRFGLIKHAQVSVIPGSGVDLQTIRPASLPEGETVVLMPCRMLQDKGVREFVAAARRLKSEGHGAEFRLLGNPDPGNPTSVLEKEIEAWVAEGVVTWHPYTRNINAALAEAHIVVLPSYREGFPKTLVDAAAAGRATVTTDVPGCRHAILPGETGLLCRVQDSDSLAETLAPLITDREKQAQMGAAGRKLAETRYGIATIAARHMEIYNEMGRDIL